MYTCKNTSELSVFKNPALTLSIMPWNNSCSWLVLEIILYLDFQNNHLEDSDSRKCKGFHNFRNAVTAAQQVHMLLSYNYILIIIFFLEKELWLTSKKLKQMNVSIYVFSTERLNFSPTLNMKVFILCHSINWMKLLFWILL